MRNHPSGIAGAIRAAGVSLVELMVALAIGSFLILGLLEVFQASRVSYQLSEGLARVQENGRFGLDFLKRDLRLAGHMGCVNDQARFQSAPTGFGTLFVSAPNRLAGNFAAAAVPLRFDTAITGYEANGTGVGSNVNILAPAAGWAPALPPAIAALGPAAGSDIVIIRYFSSEGVPMTTLVPGASATITVNPARWGVLQNNGVTNPGLFGIGDCIRATVFQAETAAAGTITVDGTGPLNLMNFATDGYIPGQTTIHRAESMVYYVAVNPEGNRALFRTRFGALPNAPLTANTEELVEGIDSMQLLYGMDRVRDNAVAPSGFIGMMNTANNLALVPAGTPAETWRRVGMVKVGLLATSPDPASTQPPVAGSEPQTLGVTFTPVPNDGRYRTVYESTIALRNRLYGN